MAGIKSDLLKSGPLTGYLRFTIRTPEDDDRLLDAIERNLP